jgi:hypothetical protein
MCKYSLQEDGEPSDSNFSPDEDNVQYLTSEQEEFLFMLSEPEPFKIMSKQEYVRSTLRYSKSRGEQELY